MPIRSVLTVIAVLIVGCATTTTHEYAHDHLITTHVRAALLSDKQIADTDIDVDTFRGIVQLSGVTQTESQRMHASNIARGISGVRAVRSSVRVP